MENAIEVKQTNAPARDIGVITEEIKNIRQQASALALLYAVEIGRRLEEAKQALPHGQWGEWLKNEVEFSQSTANNFMRLYAEYGSAQISIFGASVDSQTIANLPYSKALQLLAVPKEEREAFVEEVGAGDLSVKELKAAIEERDKAKKIAEIQAQQKKELQERLQASENARLEALDRAAEAEHLQGLLTVAEQEAEREKKKVEELRQKLKEAERDPKIPKAKLDEIRAKVEAEIKKASDASAQKALEEARKKAEEAEAEAIKARLAEQQARETLEEAQKRLKTARPEIASFKALFEEFQFLGQKLKEMISAVRKDDAETADKLENAMKAFAEKI